MEIKNKINKIQNHVKDKEIPVETYYKIKNGWDKLPFYRKLPTTRNMNLFMNDLKLNDEEKIIFQKLFKP